MDYEQLKHHYNVYSSKTPPKYFTIGNTLVMIRWGEGLWDSINIREECTTYWIKLATVRNTKGVKLHQFIFGRLMISWARLN